jgi:ATP-dependent protease HslVU (ClpYQ) peptidase subunit
MTTLVSIQRDNFVVFAADSQITDGDQRVISIQTPKIIETDRYLIGITGDSRPGDILAYAWKPPAYRGEDPTLFMGKKIIPSIYNAFKENGYDIDPKETNFGFLISFNANVYSIGGDLSFNASDRGLFGLGSGGSYGLGYLYSLPKSAYNNINTASAVLKKAVEISSILDINTCPPIQIVVQERK